MFATTHLMPIARPLVRHTGSQLGRGISPMQVRTLTNLSKTAYTARAESSGGGRDGKAKLRAGIPFQATMAYVLKHAGECH